MKWFYGKTWNTTVDLTRSTLFIEVQPNTTYILNSTNLGNLYYAVILLNNIGDNSALYSTNFTTGNITFTTTAETHYCAIVFRYVNEAENMTKDMFDNIQIQLKIEPAVFVLNSNGVYEEFIKKQDNVVEELNVSALLQNGWTQNGGCQIFKQNEVVHICLCVQNGTTKTILQLPENFRPKEFAFYPYSIDGDNISSWLTLVPSGWIEISGYGIGKTIFANFSYKI